MYNGENIMICEVNVPSNDKNGEYGLDCDSNDICHMTLNKLKILLNDDSEAFGHGLCICYTLLQELENN